MAKKKPPVKIKPCLSINPTTLTGTGGAIAATGTVAYAANVSLVTIVITPLGVTGVPVTTATATKTGPTSWSYSANFPPGVYMVEVKAAGEGSTCTAVTVTP